MLLGISCALSSVWCLPRLCCASAGMSLDPLSLAEQLRSKDAHIAKMAGTLAHYRAWASQIQARYQMFNPDAARPARRIYVGGLPPDTEDVRFELHMFQSLLISEAGMPSVS